MSRKRTLIAMVTIVAIAFIVKKSVDFSASRATDTTPAELFERALTSADSGSTDGVAEAVERFKGDSKFRRHLAVLDAAILLRGGKVDASLERVSPITEDDPVRERALLYAGEALYTLGRLAEAQQVFQIVRQEFADNLDARRWLGAIYYDLGAFDAAITEMKAIATADSDDYRPYHLLGVMFQDFENFDEAAANFQAALDRHPPDSVSTQISTELVQVLVANRQVSEAAAVLQTLPDSAATAELRARISWQGGDRSKAGQHLDKAEAAGLLSADGLQLKADLAAEHGQTDTAIAILEDLLQRFPERIEGRYQLGLLLQQAGNAGRAATELKKWEQQRELADQLIQLNLKAVSDPYDADVRDQLADICRQLGRTKLSRMWTDAANACRSRSQALIENELPR